MVSKGLKVLVSIVMALSLLTPFTIHADDYSNSTIVGFNVNLVSGESTTQNDLSTGYVYDIEWILDDYYVGSINLSFTVNGTNQFTSQARNYYVNGNRFKASFWMYQATGNNNSQERPSVANVTYTVNSTNLTKIPNGLERWDYPMESFSIITPTFDNMEYIGIDEFNEYKFPIFKIKTNDLVYHGYVNANEEFEFIFAISKDLWSQNLFKQHFQISESYEIKQYRYVDNFYWGNYFFNILYVKIKILASNLYDIRYVGTDGVYIPIYYRKTNFKNINTEFALTFGLRNEVLDNLQKIADGTTATQSASQSSDSANQQLEQDSNTLFSQENSFKNDMNNAMSNIPSFNVNTGFGGRFMTSANWVRQQYERLVTNTPFQNVITFSLLVGLSLIMLGKIRK